MRVLLVTPHFPPTHVGGVEFYTRRLAAWLLARGHQPEVVSVERIVHGRPAGPRAVSAESSGYPVHRLDLVLDPVPASYGRYWHDPAVEAWFAGLLSSRRPDLLHLQSGYLLGHAALAAARRLLVPVVVTLHDFWFVCPRVTMMHPDLRRCSGPDSDEKCAWCLLTERRRIRLPDRWSLGAIGGVARIALRIGAAIGRADSRSVRAEVARRRANLLDALASAGAVISPSAFVRTEVGRAGFEASRIRVVPLGLPPVPPPAGPPASPRSGGSLTVGYLGQIAPHKGVHVLVAAARQVRSAGLLVRVNGPDHLHADYTQGLRRQAAGDRRIHLEGAYDNTRIADLFGALDVIVVPSVWHENWPVVVLEAHRAGIPVIASRVGGLPEMIRDGVDGLLFEAGNHRELARHLERLADDPARLARLREGVRPVRTEDEELSELLALYTQCASRHPPGHQGP